MGSGKNRAASPFQQFFHTRIHKPVETETPASRQDISGVFHKFPTPYYGYYNKFNIDPRENVHHFWDSFLRYHPKKGEKPS